MDRTRLEGIIRLRKIHNNVDDRLVIDNFVVNKRARHCGAPFLLDVCQNIYGISEPAWRNLVASTLPSYDSIVFVMMTVVVSPRWTVCAVVVTVRVTLQEFRMQAASMSDSAAITIFVFIISLLFCRLKAKGCRKL